MRHWLAVVLLLSFFCQVLVTAPQTVGFGYAGTTVQTEHVKMHLASVVHHHDEAGVAYQDESSESIRHMMADAGSGTGALFHSLPLSLQSGRLPAPAVTADSLGPPPYLDGLRRPPRLIS